MLADAIVRGADVAYPLSSAQIAALNAGAAGLGLEPGALGADSDDFVIAVGVTTQPASGQLALTIAG